MRQSAIGNRQSMGSHRQVSIQQGWQARLPIADCRLPNALGDAHAA
jgi:hypothetical protein